MVMRGFPLPVHSRQAFDGSTLELFTEYGLMCDDTGRLGARALRNRMNDGKSMRVDRHARTHKRQRHFEVEKHSVHWSSCLCYVSFPCKLIAVTRPPTSLAVWTYLLYHYTKPASCFMLYAFSFSFKNN